jgi:dsRNA-specific ribonuclease
VTIAERIQRGLGHAFSSRALLEQALTHRSFSATHNERFEFLGDAVLDCIASDLLCERFPELPEGVLSRLRANLVKQGTLAEMAGELDLGSALQAGRRRGQDRWPHAPVDSRRCAGSADRRGVSRCRLWRRTPDGGPPLR